LPNIHLDGKCKICDKKEKFESGRVFVCSKCKYVAHEKCAEELIYEI